MPDAVRFHFDPRCPWCYQTSRWMRRLEELGEVTVTWAVFSLAIANHGDEARAQPESGGAMALRTTIAVRDALGNAAAGRFYAALGEAVHERSQPVDEARTVDSALEAAGIDVSLRATAMRDAATWDGVQREHDDAVRTHRAFGVPTIVVDDNAIFGPVITEVPGDAEAVELWRHTSWLVRNANFAELKRARTARPNLATTRRSSRPRHDRSRAA
ncbi:MAG: DsbA family protein [Candidatus Dormibacteraeota bacterium]|nr:DsbA family protein [Candidatus Dormibacteraeota bacterium]MBV9524486.1 DsbA family protein [Candidatus Dormibacteraeota bacterium]